MSWGASENDIGSSSSSTSQIAIVENITVVEKVGPGPRAKRLVELVDGLQGQARLSRAENDRGDADMEAIDQSGIENIITESGGRVLFLPEEPMIGVTLVAGHGGTEDLLAELVSTSCTRASRGV